MPKPPIDVDELRRGGVVKLREKDMFSIWVKTACCNLNSRQLRKLAEITERYGRGFLLFSSRQIPIIPQVNIADVPEVQRELGKVDLELDRCGPRVRNINVCYPDNVCPEAIANGISLGEKLESFFRSPMLHKVKIGVAGCGKDCIASRVLNDISFVATPKGYTASIGGRLGVNPYVGVKMAEGLSELEAVRLTQNFFEFMEREGKTGERAADLIGRFGMETVKEALTRDLDKGTGVRAIDCAAFLKGSHADRPVIKVRATCGEVTSTQLRTIADIASQYGLGLVHFDIYGGPEIPGIEGKHLTEIKQALGKVGMSLLEKGVGNLQTCFGAYCAEGLVDPQSLLRNIETNVAQLGLDNTDIHIAASGCPNACGIPHTADIGFYGEMEPVVDASACIGCGLCPQVCKRHAIEMVDNLAVIERAKCRFCGQCAGICPSNAIGHKRQGFAVLVGGKFGDDTRLAQPIADFVSTAEALRIAEACLKLVQREKTSVAGIIDRVGFEAFKSTVTNGVRV